MDRRKARMLRILGDGVRPVCDPPTDGPVLRQVHSTSMPSSENAKSNRVDRDTAAWEREQRKDAIRKRLAYFSRRDAQPNGSRVSMDRDDERFPDLAPPAMPTTDRCPPHLTPARDDLGQRLHAGVRTTPCGECLQTERVYSLSGIHGTTSLADAATLTHFLQPRERLITNTHTIDLNRAVFLDTETTGLVGGTGTVAFMVGTGRVEKRAHLGHVFVVRQYAMRDYPDEAAMLHALQEDIGDAPLITFNGRSYDWPLLQTRWRMHRPLWRKLGLDMTRAIPAGRAHMDLLLHARRLWSKTLHSRSLSTLERHVLGLDRGEDLSGAGIPNAWFHYLKSGDGSVLARAFEHNVIDIVSMVALLCHVSRIVAKPKIPVPPPGDHLGAAKLMLALDLPDRAVESLETGLHVTSDEASGGTSRNEARPLHRLLAKIHRRAGNFQAAIKHYKAAATSASAESTGVPIETRLREGVGLRNGKRDSEPPSTASSTAPRTASNQAPPGHGRIEAGRLDIDACEHVAKLYEHRFRRFDAALAWTDLALDHVRDGTSTQRELLHRAERLRRRLARAAEQSS